MGKRIADNERIERVRAWARQSSARRRVKLEESGKRQLLCWLPTELRAQLDAKATELNQNLSEVTTALLTAALKPAPAQSTPLPLFAGEQQQRGPMDERLARIVSGAIGIRYCRASRL